MAAWSGWDWQLLQALGAPVTNQNISFLDSWQNAEQSDATYNPLNTTQQAAGSTPYNSAGVQNFTSASQGIAATVQTLRNGYYPNLLTALMSGNPYNYVQQIGPDLKTWGTGSAWIDPYSITNQLGDAEYNVTHAIGGAVDTVKGAIHAWDNITKNLGPYTVAILLTFIGAGLLAMSFGEHLVHAVEKNAGTAAKVIAENPEVLA